MKKYFLTALENFKKDYREYNLKAFYDYLDDNKNLLEDIKKEFEDSPFATIDFGVEVERLKRTFSELYLFNLSYKWLEENKNLIEEDYSTIEELLQKRLDKILKKLWHKRSGTYNQETLKYLIRNYSKNKRNILTAHIVRYPAGSMTVPAELIPLQVCSACGEEQVAVYQASGSSMSGRNLINSACIACGNVTSERNIELWRLCIKAFNDFGTINSIK